MRKPENSVPRLLDIIRLSLRDVADGAQVSVNTADRWRAGLYRPEPTARKQLVRYVRKHAAMLLALADAIEREGKPREGARARQRRNAVLKG